MLTKKLRENSGLSLAVVIGAIALFVIGDLFNSGNSSLSSLFSEPDNIVGEIAGQTIEYAEYQEQIDQLVANYRNSNGQNPPEGYMQSLRDQAWRRLIAKYAVRKEYEKLGIRVTGAEIQDVGFGENIDMGLVQSLQQQSGRNLIDSVTGAVNRSAYLQVLLEIKANNEEQARQHFSQVIEQDYIVPNRQETKYRTLLEIGYHPTAAETQREYAAQNNKADISYLYVPYTAVPDSAITYDDNDLQVYFQAHKDEYEQTAKRSLEYISVDIRPTTADRQAIREELVGMKQSFAEAANDTAFLFDSEAQQRFLSNNAGNLPSQLQTQVARLQPGQVYGPYVQGDQMTLYKLMNIREDSLPNVKARHILFKQNEKQGLDTEAAAKAKANEVLRQLRSGQGDFAALAREWGNDGTKNRGGDVGWFSKGRTVKEFEEAVFDFNGTGLIPRVIKTDLGYHIIEITEPKDYRTFELAVYQRSVTPSEGTVNTAYQQAAQFTAAQSLEAFKQLTDADSTLIRLQANDIAADARFVNNLSGPSVRELVRWAFKQRKAGVVNQEVLEIDGKFVVAAVVAVQEEGAPTFEAFRTTVINEVKREKKRDFIIARLTEMLAEDATKNLATIALEYGGSAYKGEATDISLNSGSLTRVGAAPKAIGAIFGMQEGQRSQPIADQSGVVVVQVDGLTVAPEVADYSAYESDVRRKGNGNISFTLTQAIDQLAGVKDYRHKFY